MTNQQKNDPQLLNNELWLRDQKAPKWTIFNLDTELAYLNLH